MDLAVAKMKADCAPKIKYRVLETAISNSTDSHRILHSPLTLMPNLSKPCPACRCTLKIQTRPSLVTVYSMVGSIHGSSFHAVCTAAACRYRRYLSFEEVPVEGSRIDQACDEKQQTSDANVYFFPVPDKCSASKSPAGLDSSDVLMISRKTAFTFSFLEHVTSQLVCVGASFEGCAEVYNRDQESDVFQSMCFIPFLLALLASIFKRQ